MIKTTEEIVEQYDKENGWKKDTEFTKKQWISVGDVKDTLVKCQTEDDVGSIGDYGFDNRYMFRVLKELDIEK